MNKAFPAAVLLSVIAVFAGIFLGSTGINFTKMDEQTMAIVWELRLPRTILAFIVGGSLAIGGAVFQSVLKNQLASPYILGVSSGASLGAALVMTGILGGTVTFGSLAVTGSAIFPGSTAALLPGFLQPFLLPIAGFAFGFGTVLAVLAIAYRLDKTLSNNTIILFGMVFSLFINAILTTLLSVYREELKNLLIWQFGSFSLRSWNHVRLFFPFFVLSLLGIIRYTREMDILSFGDSESRAMGVNTRAVRKRLFLFSAMLTGSAVALCGAIGFVDLIAPHAARRIIGSRHRHVIPLSFCAGGILMVTADIIARMIISPSELPVGAVTALIGAPFFAWVYFGKKGVSRQKSSPINYTKAQRHKGTKEDILKLRDIFCGYGAGDVLRGISLGAKAGEFISIAGPNGCGKSTLLKAIARLLPYRGNITINDMDITAFSHRELAMQIALFGQASQLYFPYTVYETIAMGRYARSKSWWSGFDKADMAAVENALFTLNLGDIKNELISELSGGQLQRVFLGRTLVQEPRIILLDEPTNHLDIKNQVMLLDHLTDWVKTGERLIIAVFHDLHLARRYGTSAVLMTEGIIAAKGSAAEVFSGSQLSDIYGIDCRTDSPECEGIERKSVDKTR